MMKWFTSSASAADHTVGHASLSTSNLSLTQGAGGSSIYSHPGPDPLTPPVSMSVSRVLKPKPLKFEGGAAHHALPPQSSMRSISDDCDGRLPDSRSEVQAMQITSAGSGGSSFSGSEGGTLLTADFALREQHQSETGGAIAAVRAGREGREESEPCRDGGASGDSIPVRRSAWHGCIGSWGTAAVSVSVVAAAFALGCGIGLYLAAAMPMSIAMPAVLESSAARAGAIAVCDK